MQLFDGTVRSSRPRPNAGVNYAASPPLADGETYRTMSRFISFRSVPFSPAVCQRVCGTASNTRRPRALDTPVPRHARPPAPSLPLSLALSSTAAQRVHVHACTRAHVHTCSARNRHLSDLRCLSGPVRAHMHTGRTDTGTYAQSTYGMVWYGRGL